MNRVKKLKKIKNKNPFWPRSCFCGSLSTFRWFGGNILSLLYCQAQCRSIQLELSWLEVRPVNYTYNILCTEYNTNVLNTLVLQTTQDGMQQNIISPTVLECLITNFDWAHIVSKKLHQQLLVHLDTLLNQLSGTWCSSDFTLSLTHSFAP